MPCFVLLEKIKGYTDEDDDDDYDRTDDATSKCGNYRSKEQDDNQKIFEMIQKLENNRSLAYSGNIIRAELYQAY
jgi:hypothetical protein